jgi:hypothetical protein
MPRKTSWMSSRRSQRMRRRREPGDRALDDIPEDAQAASVWLASLCNHRADPALPEQAPVRVVVVTVVRQQGVRPPARPADRARNRRDPVEQGQKLGDVVAVSSGQRHRERDALPTDDEIVPAARPSSLARAMTRQPRSPGLTTAVIFTPTIHTSTE